MSECIFGTSPVNHFLISVLVLHLRLTKCLISVYDDFLQSKGSQVGEARLSMYSTLSRAFRCAPHCPHQEILGVYNIIHVEVPKFSGNFSEISLLQHG